MSTVIIVKTGSTFPDIRALYADFEDWIIAGCGPVCLPMEVVDVVRGDPLPVGDTVAGVIITGAHAMVTEAEPWMLETEAWLRLVVQQGIPVLGICFGHQLLAKTLGGEVNYHPQGPEVGSVAIHLTEAGQQDVLFSGLPQRFYAHVTHAQTISSLPQDAVVLAANAFEAQQAVRFAPATWGVQFHPEFSSSIMLGYIQAQAQHLQDLGFDVQQLEQLVCTTSDAQLILRRFMLIIKQRQGLL